MSTSFRRDLLFLEYLYQYNGKELNEDFGLDWNDYGARWYDRAIGRFPSLDPIVDQFAFVSPFNYAENEPVKMTDPNGEIPIIPIIAGIWAIAEIVMSAYDAYDVVSTLADPEASTTEKVTTVVGAGAPD